jgi:hypothetical protein
MHLLFMFVDGIGLGPNNPNINPFARADMPVLQSLLGGYRMVASTAPHHTMRASLLALDACLGVAGMPQSATGQAVLLTGKNIPAEMGYHFGPWPNDQVAKHLENGNIFRTLKSAGIESAFFNAYPERYFDSITSGKRLYSSIPLAVISAGIPLRNTQDLIAGQALSADFTGQGWHEHLGMTDTPLITPYQAGSRLAELAHAYQFSFFEYWLSDYAGHGQNMDEACRLLETFDQVLDGLLSRWDDASDLLLITSDHGNMEDLSTRRHTMNPVPALLVGAPAIRRDFIARLNSLTDITPAILRALQVPQ